MAEGKSGGDVSYFDQIPYTFKCESPECGKQFQKILWSFLQADKVVCPECGMSIGIRESKRHGDIAKRIDTAQQLDAKRMKKD